MAVEAIIWLYSVQYNKLLFADADTNMGVMNVRVFIRE